MLSQNTDLHLIRDTLSHLCHVVDRLIEQDRRISNLEQKYEEMMQKLDRQDTQLGEQNTQLQECQDAVNFMETEIPHLRYLVGRNAEREWWLDPYSQDGEPICNSEEVKNL